MGLYGTNAARAARHIAAASALTSALAVGAATAQTGDVVARASGPSAVQTAAAAPARTLAASMPVAVRAAIVGGGEGVAELRASYEVSGFAPIWSRPTGALDSGSARDWSRAARLLEAASEAAFRHAAPDLRDADRLRERLATATSGALSVEEQAALDVALTQSFLAFARALHGGAVDPRSISSNMDKDRPELGASPALRAARAAGDMTALLDSFAPQTDDYRRLLLVLEDARELGENAWGPMVPTDRTLRTLDKGPAVTALRARLAALGDLDADANAAAIAANGELGDAFFDATLEEAVRAFQTRKGLAVDGVVGRATLGQLNLEPTDRLRQAAANLERARWSNRPIEPRRLIVNIPDYQVTVYRDNQVVYRSAVVVGKRRHQTPEFSDEMTHVVVNPYWNVPYSIATRELLPIFQQDPSELFRRNMTVLTQNGAVVNAWNVNWWSLSRGYFPYRIRQNPGPGNALGDVKFIFPNHHAVYLHDTPSKSLFSRPARAFSHGCVRVAKPTELAELLLGEQADNPAELYRSLRARSGERHVRLDNPMPVHLIYRTIWLDDDGALQIRDDIYGRDERVAAALEEAGAPLSRAVY